MQLSQFFSLEEMTQSDTAARERIPNQPGDAVVQCLRTLCEKVLDPLRNAVGRGIRVNSGYRSPALNARVGGARNSQHLFGEAADLQCPGVPVLALFQKVIAIGLPFDQLIYEAVNANTKWVHVSHHAGGNRGQILVAKFDARGKPVAYVPVGRDEALALREPALRGRGGVEPGYVELGDEPELPAAPARRTAAKKAGAKKTAAKKGPTKKAAAKKASAKKAPAKTSTAARRRPARTVVR